MGDTLTDWLVANEPAISAFVGLVTLLGGAWALFEFFLHRSRTRGQLRHPASPPVGTEKEAGPLRSFQSVIQIGLSRHSSLEEKVSIRTVNAAILVILLTSLPWIALTLVYRDALLLTVVHCCAFVFALVVLILQYTGRHSLARWSVFILISTYWCVIMVIAGKLRSVEFWLPLLLVLPILIFNKNRKKDILIATGYAGCCVVVAIYLQSHFSPMDKVAEEFPAILSYAYYLNLVLTVIATFVVINFYNNLSITMFDEIEVQKMRSEELIQHIIPENVAKRIGDQNKLVADWHEEATVLVITIVGFAELSKRVSAVHLVEILSDIFVQFDALVKKHGVEKVNTMDTTYVVAAGIGSNTEPQHDAVAALALEAMSVVKNVSAKVNHPFAFCAGISTGQAVSGVIGDARPCFDIWGDTVELAHSMLDTALDNTIVVNEPAYWRLQNSFDFAEIEGESGSTYMLLGKR